MAEQQDFWKKCSICKKPIPFRAKYWVCSVSTCNSKRTGLQFCSYECFDAHLPGARHRSAWAEERTAPSRGDWEETQSREAAAAQAAAQREQEQAQAMAGAPTELNPPPPDEILVVASRLKNYIRQRSGLNTSEGVLQVLSDRLRALCDEAMVRARQQGRKTVLERDF